jgi:lambda family phage tail tape measure protein
MAKVIIAQMLKLAAYKGIASLFAGSASGSFGDAIFQAFSTNAKGNAFSGGNVIPMAKGGIVNGPTVFPMAKGMGLMGEAGPEAVMPLGRNSRGELGVKGGANVVINNLAPGVTAQPRQTDEGITIDLIMDQVANAVRQGGNPISNSLEDSYQLGRGGATY